MLLASKPDYKNRESVIAAHLFVAPLLMGNGLYAVRFVVRERRHGQMFYHHDITSLDDLGEVPVRLMATNDPVNQNGGAAGTAIKMAVLLDAIKGNQLLKSKTSKAAPQGFAPSFPVTLPSGHPPEQ